MSLENKIKDLFIIGAGNACKDVSHILNDINKIKKEWNIMLIDDNPKLHNTSWHELKVIGGVEYLENLEDRADKYVICCIGKPKFPEIRRKLIKRISNKGYKFPNIIHPNSDISDYASIGKGNVFSYHTYIGPDTKIGNFNFLNRSCQIAHGITIGNFCTIQSNTLIMEECTKIENKVYIGTGVTVYNHVTLGEGSVIGAGAVVNRDIPPYSIAVGVPAKVIKTLENRE